MAVDEYGFGPLDAFGRGGRVRPPKSIPPPIDVAFPPVIPGAPGGSHFGRAQTYPVWPTVDVPTTPAPATPATPAAFAGSPLNTMYGIDSESYLSDDQRKLARMIQGKFDSSMNRRDRELQQYGSPRLASFVEDEALARAMALARGLNMPVQDALGTGGNVAGRPVGGGGGSGGGAGRAPGSSGLPRRTAPERLPKQLTPQTRALVEKEPDKFAQWQKIMSGLMSIAPLLIGKDGLGALMDKGILGMAKGAWDKLFPGEVFNAQTVYEGAGFQINPFTGLPMPSGTTYDMGPPALGAPDGYLPDPSSDLGIGYSDPSLAMGPDYGLGYADSSLAEGPPSWLSPEMDVYTPPVDYWSDAGMWDDSYWYPDLSGWEFVADDPFGIGGW